MENLNNFILAAINKITYFNFISNKKIEIMSTQDEIKYQEALKRVKKIKGFYTHAIVYVFVNIMIVFLNVKNLDPGETYFQFKNFMTAFFWGIGLAVHGLSVFFPQFVLGKNYHPIFNSIFTFISFIELFFSYNFLMNPKFLEFCPFFSSF